MRILVIGKIESEVSSACKIVMNRGGKIVSAENPNQAFEKLLSGASVEAVLIEVSEDIKTFCENLERERIIIPVIAYGINADSEKARNAIRAGAEEYLPLPPEEELIIAILEQVTKNEESKIISQSPQMKSIVALVDRIAPSDANVLVTGESGTGKEVFAKYIHEKSNRKNENLVSLNCAAIPENLLESELFGHEKGAFTGALNRRIGKFEESHNGTLLLDEISEMDIRLQAKLLRAIQEKEITRIGGNTPIKINLRIIATSNRDLKKEVQEGKFREDLLFRLNVIHLQLPPLRERKSDIKQFAEFFAEKYAKSNGLPKQIITDEAMETLINYNWSGNVRELENTMHRAVLLSNNNRIDKTSLLIEGTDFVNSASLLNFLSEQNSVKTEISSAENSNISVQENNNSQNNLVGRTISEVEKEMILKTLDSVSGNRSKAANILGISIRTLHNKLKEYEEKIAVGS
ncbi:MAG: sigma-54 dependent transcriptional regulator [Rickettsiales bacterium]|nr:sigma-54 dependent transcriptional regulator [Rickettsiales bacterium]